MCDEPVFSFMFVMLNRGDYFKCVLVYIYFYCKVKPEYNISPRLCVNS